MVPGDAVAAPGSADTATGGGAGATCRTHDGRGGRECRRDSAGRTQASVHDVALGRGREAAAYPRRHPAARNRMAKGRGTVGEGSRPSGTTYPSPSTTLRPIHVPPPHPTPHALARVGGSPHILFYKLIKKKGLHTPPPKPTYGYSLRPVSGTPPRGNQSETSTSAHDRDADGRVPEGDGWPAMAVAVQSLT